MSHAVERIASSSPTVAPGHRRPTAAELRATGVDLLRRNWRLILMTTLVTLAFGVLFAAFAPTKYRSAAQLLIDPRGLQILKNEITRPSESADSNLVDIENQRYILLSRSVLGAVVDNEKLEDNPLFGGAQPGLLSRIAGAIGIKRQQVDRRARAMQALADMVEVTRGERAYVLDVVVTTPNADLSASLANVIAKTYLDAQNDVRGDVAKRASEELSRRAEDLRKQVQAAEEQVERYRTSHNLFQTPTGRLLSEQQIADLSTQVGLVRARIADAQARVDAVEHFRKAGMRMDSLSEALSSPTMTGLRAQYSQVAQQEASLATQLGPRHPALIQAQEQVRDVRRQITAELDRIAGAARSDLSRAKAAEASLQRQAGDVQQSSDRNTGAMVELRDLERAAEASRAVYQAFLGRSKELAESQGIDSTNARIISPAIPATRPTGAPPALVLAGSLLFGLVLGAGLGYARERLDDRIHSRQQLIELTGLPVLASFAANPVAGTDANKQAVLELVPDRAAFRNLMSRLDIEREHGGSAVAFVGSHGSSLLAQLIVGVAEFARWEDLDVGLVDSGGDRSPLADAFDEDDIVVAGRRGRVEVTHVSDLLHGASLRRLRGAFRDMASSADLVLLDVQFPQESNEAQSLVDLADTIVLVLSDADMDRNKIDATLDALRDCADKIAGFVFIGDDEAA